MKDLFNQVSLLLRQIETKHLEAMERGERFNMFAVCGVNHYENTHSRIIASLLDPSGSHGQKDKYLKLLLQVIGMNDIIDTKNAKVKTEHPTGNGRIDILIEDDKHHAIIIENKIYAQDQSEQLKRYDEFASKAYKGNYKILYLTLFGKEASSQSGKNVSYARVSYESDIIDWLGLCIEKSATLPLIRETLIQYRNHIKALTNQDMDTSEKQKWLQMMAAHAKEVDAIAMAANTDYAKYVFEHHVKDKLMEMAQKLDLECKFVNLFESSGERGIYFFRPQWRMAIHIWSEHNGEYGFYWCISKCGDCDISKFDKTKLDCFTEPPTEHSPYGWERLSNYSNWDFAAGTFSAMVDGRFVEYVTSKLDEILKEIDEKNIQMA